MTLNTNYMIAPSIEEYFVDKTSGLPLAGGQVYFYSDSNRSVLKPIYTISGSPPNYSYIQLPNPVTLSAVGTFQDANGNNVLPYYFPFTDSTASVVDLYYIQVYSSGGVLQFSREAYPNFSGSSAVTTLSNINYIPNGQFLLHNNTPPAKTQLIPGIDVLNVAEGGWTYETTHSSTDVDTVTFSRFNNYVGNPTGSPRYACEVKCVTPGNTALKTLNMKFFDVNKFANSTGITQTFTFAVTMVNNNLGTVPVALNIVKYFGSGGSTTTTTSLTSFSVTSQYTIFSNSFSFGTNSGQTIGTANDDYVQISLSFPLNTTFDISITDAILTPGAVGIAGFPNQTNAAMIDESTAGYLPTPAYDGSDFYMPVVNTATGYLVDKSSVGEIVASMTLTPINALLLCDGTAYLTSDTNTTTGIPYSRLQSVLFNSSTNAPIFGTGANFVNAYINSGTAAQFFLITNKLGAQTQAADGTTATGFTFTALDPGSPGYGFNAYSNNNSIATGITLVQGRPLNGVGISAGTSGMSVSDVHQPDVTSGSSFYIWSITALSASALSTGSGMAGKYFDVSNTTTRYRFWFDVVGEIAPAAGGNTLVQINLVSTMDTVNVASIIAAAVMGEQVNAMLVNGLPPAGSFFTFNANSTQYTVWYKVNNSGTAPSVTAAQLIEVDLTGSETNAQVATATQSAINSKYFAVPDLRGYFLRGLDSTGLRDVDVTSRYAYFSNNSSALGSYEVDMFQSHYHPTGAAATNGGGTQGGDSGSLITGNAGGVETRPVNVAVNYYIRY